MAGTRDKNLETGAEAQMIDEHGFIISEGVQDEEGCTLCCPLLNNSPCHHQREPKMRGEVCTTRNL